MKPISEEHALHLMEIGNLLRDDWGNCEAEIGGIELTYQLALNIINSNNPHIVKHHDAGTVTFYKWSVM